MSSSSAVPSSFPEGPRHAVVTPNDNGPILQIEAWFLMCVMILATFLRLLIRFTTSHIPGTDDLVLTVATLFGIAEVIAISVAVNEGLGKRAVDLTPSQILTAEKDVYVSTIFYIFTLALAKASTLLLIGRLANLKIHLLLCKVLAGVVALWSVAAVFAYAFQCALPRPWDLSGSRCFDTIAFWDIIGAVDILTDVSLLILPAMVVWDLQMQWGRKMVVLSAFSFRLALCACQIARLVFYRQVVHSSDQTYDSLAYHLTTQLQTMLAVIVACIPALKPFMDRAQSGMMAISLTERVGTYGVDSFAMQSLSKRGKASKHQSSEKESQNGRANGNGNLSNGGSNFRSDRNDYSTTVSASQASQLRKAGQSPMDDTDDGDRILVQKTVDWDVQYSDEQQHAASLHGPHSSLDEGRAKRAHAVL